jgi:hypothetical protein
VISVVELGLRAEEPKLNSLPPEPEPKLRIATPNFHRLEEIFMENIMVAEEVFEKFYNFNPITYSKKVIFKVSY